MVVWSVYVDWNNDGDFSDPGEDITAFVSSIGWRRGRDHASDLTGRAVSLSFEIDLVNTDGRFNSFLSSGPYFGNLLPGRRLKVASTHNGVTATQLAGFISRIAPRPSLGGGHTASISGFGPLGYLREQHVSMAIRENIDTGAAVNAILDAVGWPAADREIDTGATVIPYYYVPDDRNALDLLRELEASEGGAIYETTDGKIGFESRMRRLMPPYGISRATFSDDRASALGYEEIGQGDPIDEIFNKVTAGVRLREMQPESLLWTNPEIGEYAPSIAPGEGRDFWTSPADGVVAVKSWTTPEAATDFLANSMSNGAGSDLTANIAVAVSKFATAMKITLTNSGASTAFITFLQARGVALIERDGVRVRASDAASQAKYGIREYPVDAPWLPSTAAAQGCVDDIVEHYKDPHPVVSIAYSAMRSPEQTTEALERDLGDRVTIEGSRAAGLGISADFFVEAVSHSIGAGGTEHRVGYELSPASAVDTVWILGTSSLGSNTILGDIW